MVSEQVIYYIRIKNKKKVKESGCSRSLLLSFKKVKTTLTVGFISNTSELSLHILFYLGVKLLLSRSIYIKKADDCLRF